MCPECPGKVVLWMSYLLSSLKMEMKNFGRRDKEWENRHTFGFAEGRSATEVLTAIGLMAAAAQES